MWWYYSRGSDDAVEVFDISNIHEGVGPRVDVLCQIYANLVKDGGKSHLWRVEQSGKDYPNATGRR